MAFPRRDVTDTTLWLTGDVMTGRGIDQILPHPGDPRLFESYMTSAIGYVSLAERATGPIPRPQDFSYIWGDALEELDRLAPDLRLVNLETAVTTSDDAEPKGINYRMHPANLPVLGAAGVEGCVLANNHVLDWGPDGLVETLEVLEGAGLRTVGAGRRRAEALAPVPFDVAGGRVWLQALGAPSSGIPRAWAATDERPGIHLLPELTAEAVGAIAAEIARRREPGDLAVVSLHWGGNWGYEIPRAHRRFAHRLVDEAGVDLVWGHSSHHPLGIEVHRGKLILYGCGDLINDYEGISGHEGFRSDLVLLYSPTLGLAGGRLARLVLVPMRLRHFRLNRATPDEAQWLCRMLNREGRRFGTGVRLDAQGRLVLEWH
ncbi:CapA family protein [Halomonas heilongjiangensis]|uniref:Poly-gamma-glutamate biosynthesis protein n=1 Tax=Halomonas heilongjiangensis TaxID=1387883 RepID=A0A2N7TT67_9GAMM|nr:CapA family protein [Halomonas heilongjiangensis]PMR71394.1 poly-gamma-glutamate biosynthesis protein [Halomonas heilongjiangensis]PXX88665.1 poly-gamma-glutamate biosynthesis protein [Halomonas heilongjiangensis]